MDVLWMIHKEKYNSTDHEMREPFKTIKNGATLTFLAKDFQFLQNITPGKFKKTPKIRDLLCSFVPYKIEY